MKRIVIIISAALALACPSLKAQNTPTPMGFPMFYEVLAPGDTTFVDELDPAWCIGRGKKMGRNDWRKYYKMVYNFNKVYPYALVGRKMMAQVDEALEKDVTKRSQRNAYVHDVEKELFRLFEKDLKSMTVNQGMVLMRLVDRECGMSPYEIIKTYKSGFAANFWQLVAKLFSNDLKVRYDPKGKDARLEELVGIWDSGEWENFYFSIFFDYPKKTVIKQDHPDSVVKKK